MKDYFSHLFKKLVHDIASLKVDLVISAMVIVIAVILLDTLMRRSRSRRRESGIKPQSRVVAIEGSQIAPVVDYVSERLGLAGRPDAVIIENGFHIPVERKPLARKLRDRYVAQLLVYMKLVEEFEGQKPPYGYLILGPSCRRIKIDNTPERQKWLEGLITEMQGIIAGASAIPAPHPKKCANCQVGKSCQFNVAIIAPKGSDTPGNS